MAERTSNKDLSSKSESNQPQCTVEVRGFDPAETELYELYFSNPLKEGGPIKDLRLSDDKTVMYITFESPEVATNIASKEHTIKNRTLRVAVYKPVARAESNQPQCTVEVRGFDPAETELYELYFSNPQKGGGPIKNLRLSDDKTVMYITFESPEVVHRVVSMKHTAGGKTLKLSSYSAKETSPAQPKSRKIPEKEDRVLCTVMVTVEGVLQNADFYKYYFSNPSYGGGNITDVKLDGDEGVAYITFADPAGIVSKILRDKCGPSLERECALRATAYGEGVYFAVNSSYSTSTTYSPPDPAGVRRIYQCKVLVGHPTVGKHQLRVLPTRQGSYLYDSATDNVNSPSMYVIFNDTQAYPEYIISFK